MSKKIKILALLISLSVSLCLMSHTYSRYIADATGNIDAIFAKWQILLNNTDITTNTSSSLAFVPVLESDENIKENVIAPSSKGYFDINIDPTNVDVSFKYEINLELENEDIPDLMITKYAIISSDYIEGDYLELINLENNIISNTLKYNNEDIFKAFTIRVYFEWYEGENEQMNDEADTSIAYLAVTENTELKINANIRFEQVFE